MPETTPAPKSRDQMISDAKIYFGRCQEYTAQLIAVHNVRQSLFVSSGGKYKAWWTERKAELQRAANTWTYFVQAAGAKGPNLDDPKVRKFYNLDAPGAAAREAKHRAEFAELAKYGMPEVCYEFVQAINDPHTHPLMAGLRGSIEEEAAHLENYACVQIFEQIRTARKEGDARRMLEEMAASHPSEKVRSIATTWTNAQPGTNQIYQEMIKMVVSSLPMEHFAKDENGKAEIPLRINTGAAAPAQKSAFASSQPAATSPPAGGDGGAVAAWNAMSADERAGWLDFRTFEVYHTAVASGRVRVRGFDGSSRSERSTAAPSRSQPTQARSTQPAPAAPVAVSASIEATAQAEWDAMSPTARQLKGGDFHSYMEHRAIAEHDWASMTADARSGWIDKQTFVTYRLHELRASRR